MQIAVKKESLARFSYVAKVTGIKLPNQFHETNIVVRHYILHLLDKVLK